MEAARAAAMAPWTTGASTDSNAREARRRLQPIEVTKPCRVKFKLDLTYLDYADEVGFNFEVAPLFQIFQKFTVT